MDRHRPQYMPLYHAIKALYYRLLELCVCGIQPPMSQTRLDIIDKAFRKMDKTGDGVVTVADLMGTYDVSRHPKFISGEKTKEQIIKKYLDVFQRNDTDDEVVSVMEFANRSIYYRRKHCQYA